MWPLDKAEERARVGVGRANLATVVGKDLEDARAVGVLVRWRGQQLWVVRLIPRPHHLELSISQLEAEHGDALRPAVVGKVALERRARKVVVLGAVLLRAWRHVTLRAAVAGGAPLARDDEADARRVDGREQQRARLGPLMLPGDAPAEAVQHLLDEVAAMDLERLRVGGRAHLAPRLARRGDVHCGAFGARHGLRELVQSFLDSLVVRERL